MASSRNDIEMRVTADARGVATGLAPATKALSDVERAAAETEAALSGIGGEPIKLSVNDQAIENARAEIARLRGEMRQQLSTDVNADTSDAQKRIKQLQGQVRTLEQSDPTVNVDVVADTSQLSAMRGALGGIAGELAGSGGVSGGLTALSGAARAAGGSMAVLTGGTVIAGGAIVGLTGMAADAETQIAQLDALTKGLGEETFAELSAWAAKTPFAIDDATEATKKLVAAGVPLEEIPDWLNDIGNTAAATTGDLSQAATVFSQMVSKGKASYEELQQLAEAGIPVWGVLADKLGLTVAEVQKMATEGKLGADAIALTREALNELYPTAMQDQADTFNGQMSTLQDTLGQTGTSLGQLFLPLMTELAGALNIVAGWLLIGAEKLAEFDQKLRDFTGSGFFEVLASAVPGVGALAAGMDDLGANSGDAEDAASDLGGEVERLADEVKAGMIDGAEAAKAFAAEVKEAEAAIDDAIAAFAGLGGNVRTTVSFIISKDDLAEQINEAIEGTKDEAAVTLPADLKIGQISGLGDKQQELISSISSFAELGLEEGARRAELNPNFNGEKWLQQVRRETRGLLIDAGVKTEEVDRVLTNVFGLPRKVPVGADIAGARTDLEELQNPLSVPITPFVSQEAADAARATPAWLTAMGGGAVPVTPTVESPEVASAELDEVVKPGGEKREAVILTHLDGLSLAAAQNILRDLVAPETKIIKVHLQENPTGAGLSGPGAVDELLYGTGGGSSGTGGTVTKPGRPRELAELAPSRVPVKVYIDGQEVADRLELTARRRSPATVRRRA